MRVRRQLSLAAIAVVALLATACGTSMPTNPDHQLAADGVVRYKSFEGGFYSIDTVDGQHLDPINLPAAFQQDGLAVHVDGQLRSDLASIHMYGTLFEISDITQR